MAEEIPEIIEEVEEGIADESESAAEEGLDSEEVEELEAEAAAARENISALGKVADFMKSLDIPGALKTFSKFLIKNVAVGAVFYGVTFALGKLVKVTDKKGGDSAAAKAKYKKLTAVNTLLGDMTDTSKTTMQWLKDHEKDTITLDGISVPLIDIFSKYTTKMADAVTKAYEASKDLVVKKDGKTSFNIPTTSQVAALVTSAGTFVTQFGEFVKFANEKKAKFPVLNTLPVSQEHVDKLNKDLQTVKELPYA